MQKLILQIIYKTYEKFKFVKIFYSHEIPKEFFD